MITLFNGEEEYDIPKLLGDPNNIIKYTTEKLKNMDIKNIFFTTMDFRLLIDYVLRKIHDIQLDDQMKLFNKCLYKICSPGIENNVDDISANYINLLDDWLYINSYSDYYFNLNSNRTVIENYQKILNKYYNYFKNIIKQFKYYLRNDYKKWLDKNCCPDSITLFNIILEDVFPYYVSDFLTENMDKWK